MRNKIKQFLEDRGKTRYQFWKETGIATRTAYDLYSKPEQLPSSTVLAKICSTYEIQPGELLEWVSEKKSSDEESDRTLTAGGTR